MTLTILTTRKNLQLGYDNDPDKQFFLESTETEEREKDNREKKLPLQPVNTINKNFQS